MISLVDKPKLVVGLLAEDQEFQRMQADDARTAAVHAGFDVQILFAENSAILQIQQLYKAIHAPEDQRPKAIIVETVVGEGLGRVASAAARAGVGWVLINRKVSYLEGLRREHPGLPIAAVSTDQVEVGRIQARQFQALLPSGQGLVLYVQGPADTSAAQERLQGVREGLAGGPIDLKILDGQWTEASGEQAVQRWLRLKSSEELHPDVVGCQNDAMAVGVRRALEAWAARPELARLPLTGCDGLPDGGQRLVNMGQLAATVIAPSNTGPAVEAVARALKTRQPIPGELFLKPSSYPSEADILRRVTSRRAPG
ncbi:MAG: substrate-binding domain-containing protein [Vicinamibacteria bacterium]